MLTFALKWQPVMALRLSKNAVFFKDTFCLPKKKCTNGHNIHDTLVYGHWDTLQNWCLLQFSWKCDGVESKYYCALIVLAEIVSAKVLIFVLALAVALAIASAMRNWDLYSRHMYMSREGLRIPVETNIVIYVRQTQYRNTFHRTCQQMIRTKLSVWRSL